tara:strand:- start:17 stop:961 length:945 start_codon:yes stop_codon:yes gene_type:complete
MAEEKPKFKGIDTLRISPSGKATDHFPTKLPSLKYKDWARLREIRVRLSNSPSKEAQDTLNTILKDIRIKMKGGGTRQLTQNEVLILKTMPFVKKTEPNISFQNRVNQWESITGIKIHEGKGLGFQSDSARARAGELRYYSAFDNVQRLDDKDDWKDTLKDLTNAYNYVNVLNNRRVKDPLPINQKEIDKGAIDDATLLFKKNNPGQKVSKVTPTNQGNGLKITSNNGNTQIVTNGNEINTVESHNKNLKNKAIANPEWKDIEWAHDLAKKREIKNAKAFMDRARDINVAYASLNEDAKKRYLNNPITQLELEA